MNRTVASGQVWRGELIGRTKDGSHVHQLAKVVPVVDEHGVIVKHVAIKEPLHELAVPGGEDPFVTVSWLRASELRHRTMVQSARDAILISHMQSAFFVDANPAACELWGYTLEELRRRTGRSLTAPEEGNTIDVLSASLLATGHAFGPQIRMQRKDGACFWGALRLTAYEVHGQAFYVAIVRDVTEQVERERELAEQTRRLEQANERLLRSERLAALGQLSATVAHEINNPLQFIDLGLGALRDQLEARGMPADLAALLADIRNGVDRISAVTRDLASFTRADPQAVGPVQLDAVVEQSCRMANNEIRHRARLSLDLHAERPIHADRSKLAQLVTNLLVNAAHAIVEGRADQNQISVSTAERGDALVLVVEDTGHGIPEELRERIFEPFFTTKPTGRGGGLGLSVCMEIVRLHGGTLTVESEVGRGSRFEVRLPVENGLTPAPRPEASAAKQPRRGRVLVIDDDELVLRGLGRMLSREHEVVLALGGDEGLRILQEDRGFDVILCDLMMPTTDGPEVYATLAERAPELLPRMVFCSGGAFTPRARAFLSSVENELLGKPMRRGELLDVIARRL
jgi:PAS domain S-box-containing protein